MDNKYTAVFSIGEHGNGTVYYKRTKEYEMGGWTVTFVGYGYNENQLWYSIE